MISLNDFVKTTLRWMYYHGKIGGVHTPEGRILRRMRFLPPNEKKEAINEWEHCIKQHQWVFRQKKTGEWHVTLNRATLPEVLREIQ